MDDRLARLEQKLDALASRVAVLEEASGTAGLHADDASFPRGPSDASRRSPAIPARPFDVVQVAALLGRTSLVLGGAYLLRAFTKAGTLAQPIGVVAGLAYALVWMGAARFAVPRGRRMSATFHSQTAVLLTFPLVLEATSTFRVFTPATSVILLAVLASVMLASAASLRLPDLAWSSTLAATATAIVLAGITGSGAAFGACVVWLAVLTTWLGYLRDWRLLAWVTSAAADLTVLVIVGRSVQPSSTETPDQVLWLPLLLFCAYMLTFAARTLVRPHSAGAFETVQALASVLVGFGGAVWLSREGGLPTLTLGSAGLVLAVAAYTVAFGVGYRRLRRTRILEFYASLGTALILVAGPVSFSDGWLTRFWIAGAFASMYAARRLDRPGLAIHASVYALAAATQSGLLANATEAIWTFRSMEWPTVSRSGLLVLAALLLVASIPPAEIIGQPRRFVRIPKLIVLGAASYLLLGTITRLMVAAFGAISVVTIRTVGLVALTLALSWLARSWTFREASTLVYPLLVSTGLKLVFDDVLHSEPASLFIAFSAYGAALIAGPRLARKASWPKPPSAT